MKDLIISYLSTLGLAGIFLGMILEALGIPGFPGGVLVILAGLLVHEGVLDFHSALAAAFTGNTLGASAAYLLGRNVGEPFFVRYGKYLRIPPAKLQEAQELLARSAGAFLVVGRFIPGLGNITPYLVGLARCQFGTFLVYNSVFALAWGSLYLSLGMLFGRHWSRIWALLQTPVIVTAAIIIGISVLYYLWYKKFLNRGS